MPDHYEVDVNLARPESRSWYDGYYAGFRGDPMQPSLFLPRETWNEWTSGYLIGQRDRQDDDLIQDLGRS